MAGQNLWHKPYFQPTLENTNKYSISPDRLAWERKYNCHLQRLQVIETRPVYKPSIVRRRYTYYDYKNLTSQNARNFKKRTKANSLPLESKQASPIASPMGSPAGSRAVSRRGSAANQKYEDSMRRFTFTGFGGKYSSHFPDQEYPIMRRHVKHGAIGTYHPLRMQKENMDLSGYAISRETSEFNAKPVKQRQRSRKGSTAAENYDYYGSDTGFAFWQLGSEPGLWESNYNCQAWLKGNKNIQCKKTVSNMVVYPTHSRSLLCTIVFPSQMGTYSAVADLIRAWL